MSGGRFPVLVTLIAVLASAATGVCQDNKTDRRLVYAPDILGANRLFMIVLSVPVDLPKIDITVSPSDSATLLDRTPLPTKSEQRRYYFRTLEPSKEAKITFAHPDGDVTVPITIWSYHDLREFRALQRHPTASTLAPRRDLTRTQRGSHHHHSG